LVLNDENVLDENEINDWIFYDYLNNKCLNGKTILHLVCESGVFKYVKNCFNSLSSSQLQQLEQVKDKNDKTPINLAEENNFLIKYEIFKSINDLKKERNTLLHRMVKENKMTALRLVLEYASNNFFIDTIGFGLKNNENKTPFELAVDLKNSEAIYLLNHYEINDKSLNFNQYPKILYDRINYKEEIKKLADINEYSELKDNKIRNLIIEGNDIFKYIADYWNLLENLDRFKNIIRIGGSSDCAILSTLVSVGYNFNDLRLILDYSFMKRLLYSKQPLDDSLNKQIDLKDRFHRVSLFDLKEQLFESSKEELKYNLYEKKDISSLYKIFQDLKIDSNYGIFTGENLREWIEKRICEKLQIENATFKDLESKIVIEKSINNFKYLFLTGTNLSTGKCEIFSHLHTPDMIISDAVRISMSKPILFHPHKFYIKNKHGKRIVDPEKKDYLYIDGGVETNYINNETLCIKFKPTRQKSNYEQLSEILTKEKIKNEKFYSYLLMLCNFYFQSEKISNCEKIEKSKRVVYHDFKERFDCNLVLKDKNEKKICKTFF